MKKTVVIAGLGLMGGSMAMAFKEHTDWTVCGWNRRTPFSFWNIWNGKIRIVRSSC